MEGGIWADDVPDETERHIVHAESSSACTVSITPRAAPGL